MRAYFYDLDNDPVFDPEQIIEAEGLRFDSQWPKGYNGCNFNVTRRDIFASWTVKENYGLIIRDGQRIVWQGRIEELSTQRSGVNEFVAVRAVGWFVVLRERTILKWWVDNKPVSRFKWPDRLTLDNIQNSFFVTKRDNFIQCAMGTKDIPRAPGEYYHELYQMPSGAIRRLTFDWKIRTGETVRLRIYNVDNATYEDTVGWLIQETSVPTGTTDSEDHAIIGGATSAIEFMFGPGSNDTFDHNDYFLMDEPVIYANYHADHSAYASPGYTTGELVEDVLLIANDAGAALSQDYNWIDDPGYVASPFTVERPTRAADVIADLAGYGDTSLNTYGLAVWDKTGTTDDLPRVEFKARDVSDYDYRVTLNDAELANFTASKDGVELWNWIIVEYTDDSNVTRWLTPDDDSDLKDTSSIAANYRREYVLKIGQSDATTAKGQGVRFLDYHSTRLRKGSFSVQGKIQTKAGLMQPVGWCKAGCRVLVEPLGETFFIRQLSYTDSSETATFTPDLPPDGLVIWQKQTK